MSQEPMKTEESVWTKEHLQKLLHAMKHSIPQSHIQDTYTKGQRALDWKNVAFHPYSPEDCRQKWQEISQRIRKIRTLTELIVEAEGAIDNPFKKNKIHPELPKKPSPANAIFFQEKLAKFQKQHPDLNHLELFTLVSKKYTELPEHKKAKYVEKFQLAHEEYMQSMQQFRKRYQKVTGPDQHCSKNSENPAKRRRLRSRNERKELQSSPDKEQHSDEEGRRSEEEQFEPRSDPPDKPPINAYNLFCKEQWTSSEGVSSKGFITVCAQRWQQLSQRQKDEYKTRYRRLKNEYQVKLDEYLCDYDKEEQQQILKKYGIRKPHKKSTTKPIRTFPGEPPLPSRSGYMVFCSKQMKLLKSKIPKSRERMAKVNQLWQELSEKEKGNYKEEANNKFGKYAAELQRWFKTLTAEEQAAYQKHNKTKCKYLNTKKQKKKKTIYVEEGASTYRPSDSEDEDLEVSSSEEQGEEAWMLENGDEEEEHEVIWM